MKDYKEEINKELRDRCVRLECNERLFRSCHPQFMSTCRMNYLRDKLIEAKQEIEELKIEINNLLKQYRIEEKI